MHADFLRLRGKTYDYRIAYSQVQKLFLLPKPDDIHCQFVVRTVSLAQLSAARPALEIHLAPFAQQVNIDPPIRQGQTRYPYLVMQFVKDEIMELDLNLDE